MKYSSKQTALELTQPLAPGFDAETARLINQRQTPAVEKKLAKKFDAFIAYIQKRTPFAQNEQNFIEAINAAAENPVSLYKFFRYYNEINAGIASTIAILVGNIGQSRETFIDKHIEVDDEADVSFEIGEWVKTASVDEYGDPNLRDIKTGKPLNHRLLAAGLLKAIGNYAKLSTDQRNSFKTPVWLNDTIKKIQNLYGGKRDDRLALAGAIGAHIASEMSADLIEFSNACRALFIERKGEGLDAFLEKHPNITIQRRTFPAKNWLTTHGGYDPKLGIIHAAEAHHLETGWRAASLVMDVADPKERLAIQNAMVEGMNEFFRLMNVFFVGARIECQQKIEFSRPVSRRRIPAIQHAA